MLILHRRSSRINGAREREPALSRLEAEASTTPGRFRGSMLSRVSKSSSVNIRKRPRKIKPAPAIMPFTGLSCSRCMKNSATRVALMVAMVSATTTFAAPDPKSIYDAPTVMPVRIRSAISVFR